MQGFGIIRFRVIQLVQLTVDIPACIIIAGREGIAVNGSITVIERALIILQLDLGNRAVEIGFCQIRLEPNDLVEILNRQHVIFEIQGVPTDCRDAIGVQLRGSHQAYGAEDGKEYIS